MKCAAHQQTAPSRSRLRLTLPQLQSEPRPWAVAWRSICFRGNLCLVHPSAARMSGGVCRERPPRSSARCFPRSQATIPPRPPASCECRSGASMATCFRQTPAPSGSPSRISTRSSCVSAGNFISPYPHRSAQFDTHPPSEYCSWKRGDSHHPTRHRVPAGK